jgi:hypothetical protein
MTIVPPIRKRNAESMGKTSLKGEDGMAEGVYVTVVGSKHYKGSAIFQVGQMIRLVKDYHNAHDDEAIAVEIDGLGQVGYVANSTYTVARGTRSAGRIYDTFDHDSYAVIRFILKGDAIAQLLDYHKYSFQNDIFKITTSFLTPK